LVTERAEHGLCDCGGGTKEDRCLLGLSGGDGVVGVAERRGLMAAELGSFLFFSPNLFSFYFSRFVLAVSLQMMAVLHEMVGFGARNELVVGN
jgi:hypothetical protein